MDVLVLGGTRFFGVHLVRALLDAGCRVTVATRGNLPPRFADEIEFVAVDRTDADALKAALGGRHFDAVCDNICYCSNDAHRILETVETPRYVVTSSASVYEEDMTLRTPESVFDPVRYPYTPREFVMAEFGECKRQVECALFQKFPHISGCAVRFPFVTGPDDYSGRLHFYAEQIVNGAPFFCDNPAAALSFIDSKEAGGLLAWLCAQPLTGPLNAAADGTVTVGEIIAAAERAAGRAAVLDEGATPAPYNGAESFSLDTARAKQAGFRPTDCRTWMPTLLAEMVAEFQAK